MVAIGNPDFVKPGYSYREELYKRFGNKYLKLVVKRQGGHIVVVTVHWVAKVKSK